VQAQRIAQAVVRILTFIVWQETHSGSEADSLRRRQPARQNIDRDLKFGWLPHLNRAKNTRYADPNPNSLKVRIILGNLRSASGERDSAQCAPRQSGPGVDRNHTSGSDMFMLDVQ
jgi:hypothetical protein